MKNQGINLPKVLVVGEVGLTGEIRPITSAERLVNEAEKMGFENIIIPWRNKDKLMGKNANKIGVNNIREAIKKIF